MSQVQQDDVIFIGNQVDQVFEELVSGMVGSEAPKLSDSQEVVEEFLTLCDENTALLETVDQYFGDVVDFAEPFPDKTTIELVPQAIELVSKSTDPTPGAINPLPEPRGLVIQDGREKRELRKKIQKTSLQRRNSADLRVRKSLIVPSA